MCSIWRSPSDWFGAVKRLNARSVKIQRSYTVDEAARLFGVHKNIVRAWIKSGLQTIDDRRPILILGRHLVSFLHHRRQRTIQRCQAGQLYCVRCRAPKNPAARMVDYIPITSTSGNSQSPLHRLRYSHAPTRITAESHVSRGRFRSRGSGSPATHKRHCRLFPEQ